MSVTAHASTVLVMNTISFMCTTKHSIIIITVGYQQYKKRLSHAKAQNEQLEHEVINMESQGNILHGKIIPG